MLAIFQTRIHPTATHALRWSSVGAVAPRVARPVGGKLMVQLHELRKDEARDVGLLIEAEEIDNSPLKKNPKQAVERKVDVVSRSSGVGRRKTSTARAVLQPGSGLMWINGNTVFDYFPRMPHRAALLGPFQVTRTAGIYDCTIVTSGGGLSGQAEASKMAISRALQNHDPVLRAVLRDGTYLTRDRRAVERKKPGQKKARKAFQYPKR